MLCQVWYSHERKDRILSSIKDFEADSVEAAKDKALVIIKQSAKRWKPRSYALAIVLFLREINESAWTQAFFLRRSHNKNRGMLLRARSPKCWRAYGEYPQD